MNLLILALIVSLGSVDTVPIKEANPPGPKAAAEANDPTIAHLSQTLDRLNEALIALVANTRHPESSKQIKTLRERIKRTEDALEKRRAALRPPQVFPLPPAPVSEPPLMLL